MNRDDLSNKAKPSAKAYTYEDFQRDLQAVFAEYGITVETETPPPPSSETKKVQFVMVPRRDD